MILEDMTLTEVYQTGEDKYHTILLTREIQNTNKQTWENRKRGTGSENKQVTAGLGERLRGTTYIENKQALRLQCATRGTEAILYTWSTTLQKSDSFSCTPETYILLCINSISQKRKKNTQSFSYKVNESQVWNSVEKRVKNVASLNGGRW